MSLYDRLARHATKELNYHRLMELVPTELGWREGVTFYEHPLHGDEVPMIAAHGESKRACLTDCWEMDALDDYD